MKGLSMDDCFPPPYWPDDTEDPAGNYLAGALKQIHDSSASVFPESEYSCPTAAENRWKSTVHADFIPIQDMPDKTSDKTVKDNTADKTGENKTETEKTEKTRELGQIKRPILPRMFNKWRVPSRLTSHGGSVQGDVDDDDMPSASRAGPTPQLPTIEKPSSAVPPASARPNLNSYRPASHASAPPFNPRATAPNTAREIRTAQSGMSVKSVRSGAGREYGAFPSQRRNTPMISKSLATKQVLRNYTDPSPHEKSASELLKNTTDHEKKLIEAALKTYQGNEQKKTNAINDWFNTASSKEKDAAKTFFEHNLSSSNPSSQRKIANIIHRLHKGVDAPGNKTSYPDPANHPANKLQHLRLLSPQTRANKQHYQTWHHMAGYGGDRREVINRTSIYTEPQRIPPRHFIIHPDLG